MKIVVYGPERRVGALEGDRVIDLARASGEGLPSELLPLIEAGPAALEKARQAIDHATGARAEGVVFPVQSVSLHAPWPGKRIACVGGNFADHLMGMFAGRPGGGPSSVDEATREARATGQWGFWKVPDEPVGPGGEVPYPARTSHLDYEGEVGIVIGRRLRDLPAADYRAYVWGVTLLNDGSIRDGGGGQQPRGASYNLGKNFDGATAIGPCIVVDELAPENVDVETRVNGELRQRFNSSAMIFGWGEVLEYLSRDFTFVPGDILSGGTGAGTAADSTRPGPDGSRSTERFLHRGDTLEISSPQIGKLPLRVV